MTELQASSALYTAGTLCLVSLSGSIVILIYLNARWILPFLVLHTIASQNRTSAARLGTADFTKAPPLQSLGKPTLPTENEYHANISCETFPYRGVTEQPASCPPFLELTTAPRPLQLANILAILDLVASAALLVATLESLTVGTDASDNLVTALSTVSTAFYCTALLLRVSFLGPVALVTALRFFFGDCVCHKLLRTVVCASTAIVLTTVTIAVVIALASRPRASAIVVLLVFITLSLAQVSAAAVLTFCIIRKHLHINKSLQEPGKSHGADPDQWLPTPPGQIFSTPAFGSIDSHVKQLSFDTAMAPQDLLGTLQAKDKLCALAQYIDTLTRLYGPQWTLIDQQADHLRKRCSDAVWLSLTWLLGFMVQGLWLQALVLPTLCKVALPTSASAALNVLLLALSHVLSSSILAGQVLISRQILRRGDSARQPLQQPSSVSHFSVDTKDFPAHYSHPPGYFAAGSPQWLPPSWSEQVALPSLCPEEYLVPPRPYEANGRSSPAPASSANSVKSVPYSTRHWRAGHIRGDRVVEPRSPWQRAISVAFEPRPKLEVLPPGGWSEDVDVDRVKYAQKDTCSFLDRDILDLEEFTMDSPGQGRQRLSAADISDSRVAAVNVPGSWVCSTPSPRKGSFKLHQTPMAMPTPSLLRPDNVLDRTRAADRSSSFALDGLSAMLLPHLLPDIKIGQNVTINKESLAAEQSLCRDFEQYQKRLQYARHSQGSGSDDTNFDVAESKHWWSFSQDRAMRSCLVPELSYAELLSAPFNVPEPTGSNTLSEATNLDGYVQNQDHLGRMQSSSQLALARDDSPEFSDPVKQPGSPHQPSETVCSHPLNASSPTSSFSSREVSFARSSSISFSPTGTFDHSAASNILARRRSEIEGCGRIRPGDLPACIPSDEEEALVSTVTPARTECSFSTSVSLRGHGPASTADTPPSAQPSRTPAPLGASIRRPTTRLSSQGTLSDLRRRSLGSEFGLTEMSSTRRSSRPLTEASGEVVFDGRHYSPDRRAHDRSFSETMLSDTTLDTDIVISSDGTFEARDSPQSGRRSIAPTSPFSMSTQSPDRDRMAEAPDDLPPLQPIDLRAIEPVPLHFYQYPAAALSTVAEMSEEAAQSASQSSHEAMGPSNWRQHTQPWLRRGISNSRLRYEQSVAIEELLEESLQSLREEQERSLHVLSDRTASAPFDGSISRRAPFLDCLERQPRDRQASSDSTVTIKSPKPTVQQQPLASTVFKVPNVNATPRTMIGLKTSFWTEELLPLPPLEGPYGSKADTTESYGTPSGPRRLADYSGPRAALPCTPGSPLDGDIEIISMPTTVERRHADLVHNSPILLRSRVFARPPRRFTAAHSSIASVIASSDVKTERMVSKGLPKCTSREKPTGTGTTGRLAKRSVSSLFGLVKKDKESKGGSGSSASHMQEPDAPDTPGEALGTALSSGSRPPSPSSPTVISKFPPEVTVEPSVFQTHSPTPSSPAVSISTDIVSLVEPVAALLSETASLRSPQKGYRVVQSQISPTVSEQSLKAVAHPSPAATQQCLTEEADVGLTKGIVAQVDQETDDILEVVALIEQGIYDTRHSGASESYMSDAFPEGCAATTFEPRVTTNNPLEDATAPAWISTAACLAHRRNEAQGHWQVTVGENGDLRASPCPPSQRTLKDVISTGRGEMQCAKESVRKDEEGEEGEEGEQPGDVSMRTRIRRWEDRTTGGGNGGPDVTDHASRLRKGRTINQDFCTHVAPPSMVTDTAPPEPGSPGKRRLTEGHLLSHGQSNDLAPDLICAPLPESAIGKKEHRLDLKQGIQAQAQEDKENLAPVPVVSRPSARNVATSKLSPTRMTTKQQLQMQMRDRSANGTGTGTGTTGIGRTPLGPRTRRL